MTRDDRPKQDSARREGRRRALALGALSLAAAAGFGVLAAAVARRDTAEVDEAVLEAVAPPEGHPVRDAAEKLAPVGKWWSYIPMALAASAYVLAAPGLTEPGARRARAAGVGALLLAGTAATALNPAFDEWLPQPPTPPGHPRRKPVFPSGHAFGPGTVSLAAAYVASRERVASPGVAIPVALAIPLVSAGGRMVQEKHWASDVAGGLLGGVAVAAAFLAVYEAARA